VFLDHAHALASPAVHGEDRVAVLAHADVTIVVVADAIFQLSK